MAKVESTVCDWCGRLVVPIASSRIEFGRDPNRLPDDVCGRCTARIETLRGRVKDAVAAKKAKLAQSAPVVQSTGEPPAAAAS